MTIQTEIQLLQPSSKVRLVEIDGSEFSAPVLRIHASFMPFTPAEIAAANGDPNKLKAKSLWWRGMEFDAHPMEITGIGASADQSQDQPTLRVANLAGVASAICRDYDDMARARVTIWDTFGKYLDARNFPGGNPTADPNSCFESVFYIDAKTDETPENVSFQLANPLDLDGLLIPSRQITTVCTWACRNQYRTGNGCTYNGPRHVKKDGTPTDDPALDQCPGSWDACEYLFGKNQPTDFGGFPAAGLIK